MHTLKLANTMLFLSTLSLRRATDAMQANQSEHCISIHALLAESDQAANGLANTPPQFLSTLSLRRATNSGTQSDPAKSISIHALLAESDSRAKTISTKISHFYPRSPCGERQHQRKQKGGIQQFLSTLSLRRATNSIGLIIHVGGFLSTLSLRRATATRQVTQTCRAISIHALLAESDPASSQS